MFFSFCRNGLASENKAWLEPEFSQSELSQAELRTFIPKLISQVSFQILFRKL
jgi:hypothetical protein